jgi:hypothetical protein
MKVTITDKKQDIDYQFFITVTNQAPIVTAKVPVDLTIDFGKEFLFTLPASIDPEGLPYNTSI